MSLAGTGANECGWTGKASTEAAGEGRKEEEADATVQDDGREKREKEAEEEKEEDRGVRCGKRAREIEKKQIER